MPPARHDALCNAGGAAAKLLPFNETRVALIELEPETMVLTESRKGKRKPANAEPELVTSRRVAPTGASAVSVRSPRP